MIVLPIIAWIATSFRRLYFFLHISTDPYLRKCLRRDFYMDCTEKYFLASPRSCVSFFPPRVYW